MIFCAQVLVAAIFSKESVDRVRLAGMYFLIWIIEKVSMAVLAYRTPDAKCLCLCPARQAPEKFLGAITTLLVQGLLKIINSTAVAAPASTSAAPTSAAADAGPVYTAELKGLAFNVVGEFTHSLPCVAGRLVLYDGDFEEKC